MDPTRFDSLTRTLISWVGQRPSRRQALRLLSGGLVALALKPISEASAKGNKNKQKKKDKQRKVCQNKFGPGLGTFCQRMGCFDLLTDPAHCGGCFNVCAAGQTCAGGRCTGPSTTCTPNCAGKACGADNSCGSICTTGSCPTGQTCRGDGACIGGGCNPACGYNTTCQNGLCVPATTQCPAPFVCSGGGGEAPGCGDVVGPGGVVGRCGCYRSTEGNNICVNETDAEGDDISFVDLVPCTTSQDCREGPGLHWFCRAVTTNGSGQTCGSSVGRCWPECDSPAVTFRASAQGQAAGDSPRGGKSPRHKKDHGHKA